MRDNKNRVRPTVIIKIKNKLRSEMKYSELWVFYFDGRLQRVASNSYQNFNDLNDNDERRRSTFINDVAQTFDQRHP